MKNNLTTIFKINKIIFFVTLITYLSFQMITISRGSAFVFSENLIFTSTFLLILIVSVCVIVYEKLLTFRKENNRRYVASLITYVGITVGLFAFIIYYGPISLGYIIRDNIFIFNNLNLSRDEKFSEDLGYIFYNLTKLITDNTEEDSTIMIAPKGGPYSKTGNANYFRYFVYPRHVVNGELDDSILDGVDYVLIVRGEKEKAEPDKYFWPVEKIEAEKIYALYEDGEIIERIDDYIPEEFDGIGGLIKLKK